MFGEHTWFHAHNDVH
jgi:hypothetical protein